MSKIFISYRRADSRKDAGRIRDYLANAFGREEIFMDIDAIPAGADFRGYLQEVIAKTEVVLVIIGPMWLTATDSEGRRRLDNPQDFVRLEIEAALKRDDIVVLPVLVDGASMPPPDHLPSNLREIAFRNATVVRDDPDFIRDVERLVDYLREHTAISHTGKTVAGQINTQRLLQGCRDSLLTVRGILGPIGIVAIVIVLIYIASSSLGGSSSLSVLGLIVLSLVSGTIGAASVFIYFNRDGLLQYATYSTSKASRIKSEKKPNNTQPKNEVGAERVPRVFISYKRIPNAMHANYIELGLEIKGIDVFMDVSQQDGAIRFPDRLLDEIERSDIVICMLSDQTYNSDWVLKEIQHAHKHTKPMIPIFSESFKDWLRDKDSRTAIMSQLEEKGFLESVEYLEQHQAVHFYDHDNQYIRYAIEDLYERIIATSINRKS
jgi:TIR domain